MSTGFYAIKMLLNTNEAGKLIHLFRLVQKIKLEKRKQK